MTIVLIVLAAVALAALSYGRLERLGRRGLLPGGLRAVAYVAIGLLLANVSCERLPERQRAIALLDASLSMGADTAFWRAARAEAARIGDVRLVGPLDADSLPIGGSSRIAQDVVAASAAGRPVWLVTDGEVDDAADVPSDLRQRLGVRLLPRPSRPDLALTRVDVPSRVAIGDTLRMTVEIAGSGTGLADQRQVTVDVSSNGRRWLSGVVALVRGAGIAELETVVSDVPAGGHLLDVVIRDAADGEPRTDARNAVITVTPTPGIVLIAAPPSWESRFLFRTLGDVAALPVRGFVAVGQGDWRRIGDLGRVAQSELEQAARQADVLVLMGDPPAAIRRTVVRGRWEWPATSSAAAPAPGDWYLHPSPVSPVGGAFVGLPLDSFPPAVAMATLTPSAGDWVGLTAQASRRGAERPVVIGRDSAGRREVIVGVAGLWRWAFRGGSSEQAYRALVASTTTWLLGGTDSLTGRARPLRTVVQRGQPVVFERLRPDSLPIAISLQGPGGQQVDSLRFDGAGRAELRLEPGGYRYRLAGGGSGLVAVETYSDEYRSRAGVLDSSAAAVTMAGVADPLRDAPWLFAVAALALLGEWWWRRRAGLR